MNLVKDHIPSLFVRIAVPASIGMVFQTFYNLVDTYFGGQYSAEGLAALSLSFAPFLLIISAGIGISQGTSALIANALGSQNTDKARCYQMQSITLSVIVSFFLTFLGIWIIPSIIQLMGGQGEVLRLALEYINIIIGGCVIMILVQTLNSGLLAQGDTKSNRNALIAGFFLNVLLDPLLMYGWGPIPALGIAGIAWATVIIQALVVIYLGFMLFKSPMMAGSTWRDLTPHWETVKEVSYQGFPASLSMILGTIGIFIITRYVGKFGDYAIAAYGVAIRVEQVILLPCFGLNIAAMSLAGQNYGARELQRVQEIALRGIGYATLGMTLGGALVYITANQMMSLFTEEPEVIQIGVQYLHIDSFVLPAYAIVFLSISILQGLKRPLFGLIVGFFRQILAPSLIFWLAVTVWDYGLLGVWWGIFIATWSGAVLAAGYLYWILHHFEPRRNQS